MNFMYIYQSSCERGTNLKLKVCWKFCEACLYCVDIQILHIFYFYSPPHTKKCEKECSVSDTVPAFRRPSQSAYSRASAFPLCI